MKVEVINEFIDVHTKKLHKVGETLEVTEKRFAEIEKVGRFVKEAPEKEETTEKVEAPAKEEKKVARKATKRKE